MIGKRLNRMERNIGSSFERVKADMQFMNQRIDSLLTKQGEFEKMSEKLVRLESIVKEQNETIERLKKEIIYT